MDVILSSAKWQSALVYLDDIVIFSKSVEEHMQHARKVLTLPRDTGVTLKTQKVPPLRRWD